MLGKGDSVSVMSNYCHGATRYCSNPAGGARGSGALFGERDGSTYAMGNVADAYYNETTAGGLELPNAYNIVGGISHHWNAQWQSSLYGAYFNYQANSNAVDTVYCGTDVAAGGAARQRIRLPRVRQASVLRRGCRNFSAWQIGSRLLWNPVCQPRCLARSALRQGQLGHEGRDHRQHGWRYSGDSHLRRRRRVRGLVRVQRNFCP